MSSEVTKKHFALLLVLFGFFFSPITFARLNLCSIVESKLTDGDLIFIALANPLFKKVAEGTDSWASHVGIAFKDQSGGWSVWESTFPLSKKTKLCEYVKRADQGLLEIKQTRNTLSKKDVLKLKSSINKMMNVVYDQGFDLEKPNSMFCSKLAYLAFLNVGLEIGKVETLQELANSNPSFDFAFFNWWYLGNIPWERKTVTPASQLEDSDLFSVFKSPFLK